MFSNLGGQPIFLREWKNSKIRHVERSQKNKGTRERPKKISGGGVCKTVLPSTLPSPSTNFFVLSPVFLFFAIVQYGGFSTFSSLAQDRQLCRLGRTLPRALCDPKWGVNVCAWIYPRPADHGGASHASNNRKTHQAINALASGKASGGGGIPGETLKTGKPVLMQHLCELLCLCWKMAMFLKICRTPSLSPSTRTKAIAVIATTTEAFTPQYCWESLCTGFSLPFEKACIMHLPWVPLRLLIRLGRSTTDMIFSLRQVQEKYREQQMPLYIVFIDLTKAFNRISRRGLLGFLKKIGCPPATQAMFYPMVELLG